MQYDGRERWIHASFGEGITFKTVLDQYDIIEVDNMGIDASILNDCAANLTLHFESVNAWYDSGRMIMSMNCMIIAHICNFLIILP